MTAIDTRTPQEIAYDSLKDGSAYITSEATPLEPREAGRAAARNAALETITEGFEDDDELTADEALIIDIILARTPNATDSVRRGVIDGYRAGCEMTATLADAGAYAPVPPLEGYPDDRALIYDTINNTFIGVDRRDGELVLCDKAIATRSIIIKPAQAVALFQFLSHQPIRDVMLYAWRRYLRETCGDAMGEFLDLVEQKMLLPELPEAGPTKTAPATA